MKLDRVTALYLGTVLLCVIVYTGFDLTPSSYGVVLAQIGAPEEGPVLGTPRSIRADEWAGATPILRAAVRNGFQRINETSFYREDLRNVYALPLKDWSLIFKPELWAFFIVSPARAFSFYYALMMCGFLVGYFLFFRQMELDPFVCASAAVILFFSGLTQFFWTTFAPLTAGLPWILLILFAQLRWWMKALLYSWAIPVLVFSYVYPTFFAEFAFAAIVLVMVLRPSLFRSRGELAAIAIGGLVTACGFYLYYQDLIPVMRNTWYPGRRISGPGTVPVTVAFSQIFPFLTFTLGGYRNLTGGNICEIGTVASFLPLLTYSLLPTQLQRLERSLRNGLIAILSALALITLWQLAPVPRWIGHVLLWDHGDPQRLLFISGFLITVGCLLMWRQKVLQPDPRRIALFVAVGPVLSLMMKVALFHLGLRAIVPDLALCGLGLGAGVLACLIPIPARLPLLLGAIALMNVVAFGRFNPLQPAAPIFQAPETEALLQLRHAEASTPGRVLLEPRFFGATLNGLGFRSINHALPTPSLSVFRQYFPAMDAGQFDLVFNRYAYIQLTDNALPRVRNTIFVEVPLEAFEPARNTRGATLEVSPHKDCSIQRGGAINLVSMQGNQLTVEGWAPWKGEDSDQQVRVTGVRNLRVLSLRTVKRPDIAESLKDYAYARSGFQLQLTSVDGHPIQPDEIVVVAQGTSQGLAELSGCGCP